MFIRQPELKVSFIVRSHTQWLNEESGNHIQIFSHQHTNKKINVIITKRTLLELKPWPNWLEQVMFNLRFIWSPTWLWLSSNLDASSLPFGHPAQVDTSWAQVICRYKNTLTNDMREIYSFLRLASRLANLFGHPSQVCTQVLIFQTCVNLWARLARALYMVRLEASMWSQLLRSRNCYWIKKSIKTISFHTAIWEISIPFSSSLWVFGFH